MDDSDSDFSDVGETIEEERRVNENKKGSNVRGEAKAWTELYKFETAKDFKSSDIAKKLEEEFSCRKNREFQYADVLEYDCKFKRRVGYLPCPWKLKVSFFSHNSEVSVETPEDVLDHIHKKDPEVVAGDKTTNFKWPDEATKIIEKMLKNNHNRPHVIRRALNESNVFGTNMPSKVQLYNKVAATKKSIFPSTSVRNTHQLRLKIADLLEEPASDLEAFVPHYEIDDVDENKDPRFNIFFSSKKNLRKLKSDRLLQTDATYRLNWLGFPVYVVGTSSPTGRLFPSIVVLPSHEDTDTWASIYNFVKSIGVNPIYQMGDGAKAITKAGNRVFGHISFSRLMCWSHVHRNITPQLKSVSTHNKSIADSILQDIVDLQWSALNLESFRMAYDLLENKYLGQHDPVVNASLSRFFAYMRKVWIESGESLWFEGANPWGISNNQGIEGQNKQIKQSHTFRRRLDIGELVSVLARLASEWSDEDDCLLESPRLSALDGERDSLSLKTDGYQWYQANKSGTDKIIRINPKDRYTVTESAKLGKVVNIWAVNSTEGLKSAKSLKERAKERIAQRKCPISSSFDEYLKVRGSCWIIEERDGDYYCDCPVGMKGKLCKITVGLLYWSGRLKATPEVRSIPLGEKRKKGRPKKIPNCLVRSPPRAPAPDLDVGESVDLPDVHTVYDVPAAATTLDVGLKKTSKKRKLSDKEHSTSNKRANVELVQQSPVQVLHSQSRCKPGLGKSKPPKKQSKKPHPSSSGSSLPPILTATISAASNIDSCSSSDVVKPNPVTCKKRIGSCSHEIVFGQHYNLAAWTNYADSIRRKKSTIDIDPHYMPK